MSAGAVGSPCILQRSGIGGSWLGDSQKVRSEGVGENLQDHLQIRLVFRVNNTDTLNTLVRSVKGLWKVGSTFYLDREGPLTMAPSQLGAFVHSGLDPSGMADLQYHVQPLSLNSFGEPLHPFNGITMSVCNLRPTSRGTVRIADNDPKSEPKINLNYLESNEDKKKAARSIRMTR